MRIVVKIGSSTLTHKSGKLNIRLFEQICKVIGDLKNDEKEIVIVSSGAIALGVGKLALSGKPSDMPTKQAAAAVGQCELMYSYDKFFAEYGHTVAQILVTSEDIENCERSVYFRNTVFRLLDMGVLPIVNENDTVSTSEISVGDNDTLAALVSVGIDADLLVLLSDIDGLYTDDPRINEEAELISVVNEIDENVIALGGGAGSGMGTGGMATKIKAAQICTARSIDMVIINGSHPELLYTIAKGGNAGTRFSSK